MLPLSFSEYYAFKQGDKSDAYDDYSVYGGLPAVALMTTEEQKTNYLISQMKNVYLRDIVNRYSVHQVDVGTVESREKDAAGKEIRIQREIDFIATLGSKKYYIQSAYAIPDHEKYKQETMSFERTMDSFKKIIIIEKSMKPRYDENGYLMMGVKEFLLDANSLLI